MHACDGKGRRVYQTVLYEIRTILFAIFNQHFIFLYLIFFKNRIFNRHKTFRTPEEIFTILTSSS